MPELVSDVAAHPALAGPGCTAWGATLGRIGPEDREAPDRAGTAFPFGGTPGADNTADGRATDDGLGMAGLAALLAAVPVVAVPAVAAPGALGAAAGCAVDATVAVME
jgi:hypothetical protein